ncbi:MAG: CoA transferase subunit A [SAR324 cluster bacterium]|nr:CoA transferase subunit A [SAR324 cluster bacterium]MBL7035477.1 CoA transferase subunit A [SAR324 cluster bacterium]
MNKQKEITETIAKIPSGATVMVGGFGSPGTPFTLLDELLRQGQDRLTLIKNDANEPGYGIAKLIEADRVDTLIASHIGLNRQAVGRMNSGQLRVEFYPQGILAEKIRTAGAGLFGFLSDIGIETEITDPSQIIEWQVDKSVTKRKLKVETALHADFALIHAARADHFGNLIYTDSAINFNPLMAMAAENVFVETFDLQAPGAFPPEQIHTPFAFVSTVVQVDLSPEYELMEHYV